MSSVPVVVLLTAKALNVKSVAKQPVVPAVVKLATLLTAEEPGTLTVHVGAPVPLKVRDSEEILVGQAAGAAMAIVDGKPRTTRAPANTINLLMFTLNRGQGSPRRFSDVRGYYHWESSPSRRFTDDFLAAGETHRLQLQPPARR